jgi:hypothetical protein
VRLSRRGGLLGLGAFALLLAQAASIQGAGNGCQSCPPNYEGPNSDGIDTDICGQGTPYDWTDEPQDSYEIGSSERRWAYANDEICFHFTEYYTEWSETYVQQNPECLPRAVSESWNEHTDTWQRRLYGSVDDCCRAFGCD